MRKPSFKGREKIHQDRHPTPEDVHTDEEIRLRAELRCLGEERTLLDARLTQAREELTLVGEPEPRRLAKALHLFWLFPFLIGTLVLAVGSNLWGLEAFTGINQIKRFLFACFLPFLSLIGGVAIGTALRMPLGEPFRKLKFGIGFSIIVLAIFGTIMLNFVRGLDAAWIEEGLQSSVELSDDLNANTDPEMIPASRQTQLAPFFTIASIAMGVAGELGSAFAFDQLLFLLVPVWTVARLQGRIRRLEADHIQTSYLEELIRGTLHALQNQSKKEILSIGDTPPPREKVGVEQQEDSEERLAPLAWKIIFTILALAFLIGISVQYASASELIPETLVLLDCSTSLRVNGEFHQNLAAVEGIIRRIDEGDARILVFCITKNSFAEHPLLSATAPRNRGRYNENINAWKKATIRKWRSVSSNLSPVAKGSDLFGAIARAGIAMSQHRTHTKKLIILSDMRQYGRGYNFEIPLTNVDRLLEGVHQQGFIPPLPGVHVWVLAAHTFEIDERDWVKLRKFWTQYFERAGATVHAFSPSRRYISNGVTEPHGH